MEGPTDVTGLLQRWQDGDQNALDRAVSVLYEELRGLARARLRSERTGHTLGTTGLVHEAFLRLVDLDRIDWQDRRHFLAMASRMMRRVLVDHARRRDAAKRGGDRQRVELEDGLLMTDEQAETVVALDRALERLQAEHPRAARAVGHRYISGFGVEETAELLDVSVSTVERDIRFARAWLAREWGA